ncbi:MAG: ACP S-malonyltransferase [Clostridia bacterium]|nr:ACP S-malonyltransferase [Clostridia bacterium]
MEKIALLFPGQGSQYVGMGKALYEQFAAAKQTFNEANEVLGFDLKNLCFEGSIDELTKTENTQPALLTASVAAFRVFMQETGMIPAYLAGHSLGEFSALTCAGCIRFSDALKIVRQRGKLMQEAAAASMGAMSAVIGLDRKIVEEECKKACDSESIVVVSNYNSPDQIVVSGHKNAVSKAGDILTGLGARVMPLKVSAPFHSPLMKPASDKFVEELIKYEYGKLEWPVMSNVTALPYTGSDGIIESLKQQMVQAVRWQESMEYLKSQGVTAAIELGPQTVVKNLMKKNAPKIKAYAYDKDDDRQDLKKLSLETGINKIKGKSTVNLVTRCLTAAVTTKNSNWDNEEYQKGVIEPYKKIQKIQDELDNENREPTLEEMRAALEMLRSVLITKKLAAAEQVERINEILDETGTRDIFPDFKII